MMQTKELQHNQHGLQKASVHKKFFLVLVVLLLRRDVPAVGPETIDVDPPAAGYDKYSSNSRNY